MDDNKKIGVVVFFAIGLLVIAVVANTSSVSGNSAISGYGVVGIGGRTAAIAPDEVSVPEGKQLGVAGHDDFEKGKRDIFNKRYYSGGWIDNPHRTSEPSDQTWRRLYVKTSSADKAGTDSVIKYWVVGTKHCLWSKGNHDPLPNGKERPGNADWKVESVENCAYSGGGLGICYGVKFTGDTGWLRPDDDPKTRVVDEKNILCWEVW